MPSIEIGIVQAVKKALVDRGIDEKTLHDLGILTRGELFFLINMLAEEYDFVKKNK